MSLYLDTPGRFTAKTRKPHAGWFGEAGNNNTPFIEVLCEVTDGPEAGKLIHWRGFLSDRAIDRTVAALTKACGFSGDLDALESGAESLADRAVEIVVEMETYEGKTRAKVKWLNPVGGGRKALAKDKTAEVVSRWADRAKAAAESARAEMAADAAPLPPAVDTPAPAPTDAKTDGDVPF